MVVDNYLFVEYIYKQQKFVENVEKCIFILFYLKFNVYNYVENFCGEKNTGFSIEIKGK